jgi:hypothetical protein
MRRFTYANVVATLALFVALGGSAAAAFVVSSNSEIGPNTIYGAHLPAGKNDNFVGGSIGSSDLANDAVTGPKLATGSVASGKLADKAVIAGKLGDGAVALNNLASGAVGTSKLADGSVTLPKLGNDVIDDIDSHTGTASQFTGTVPLGGSPIVKTIAGVMIQVSCVSSSVVSVALAPPPKTNLLEASGTSSDESTVFVADANGAAELTVGGGPSASFDGIVRNRDVGTFFQLDAHAFSTASGCKYWGVSQLAS